MCVETLRTGLNFPRQSIWGVTCLGFTQKMNVFPSISFETTSMFVETLRTGLDFWDNWFEGSHALLYHKNKHFPIYLLQHPINVWWNPQNRARFSETINLRGHMPSFILNSEHIPIFHLANPINVCLKPHNWARFSKMMDLRNYMPRFYLKTEHSPIYLIGNPINVCWNPQNRVHFSKMIDFRGHMPSFTLKINVFPSTFLETP